MKLVKQKPRTYRPRSLPTYGTSTVRTTWGLTRQQHFICHLTLLAWCCTLGFQYTRNLPFTHSTRFSPSSTRISPSSTFRREHSAPARHFDLSAGSIVSERNITIEEFQTHLLPSGRPFVARGAATSWPATTLVDRFWLRDHYGEVDPIRYPNLQRRKVVPKEGKMELQPFACNGDCPSEFFADATKRGNFTDLDFRGSYIFLQAMNGAKDPDDWKPRVRAYGDLVRTPDFFPPDIQYPSTRFFDTFFDSGPNVYMGGPLSGTGAQDTESLPSHSDVGSCSFIWQVQTRGKKRWRLVNPINHTDIIFVDIVPGDIILLQPQWYHDTKVLGDQADEASISLIFYEHKPWRFGVRLTFLEDFWNKVSCGKVYHHTSGEDISRYYQECYENWFGSRLFGGGYYNRMNQPSEHCRA